MSDGSVTLWFQDLREGDAGAASLLWQRFGTRILRVAREKLSGVSPTVADEEDIVQSAFFDLCRGAEQGRFEYVTDRESLWRLLMLITARKAANRWQHERRLKRRGPVPTPPGQTTNDLALCAAQGQLESNEPTPDFAAEMDETCRNLLDVLGDSTLQQIAVWKMEGYDHEEIAQRLGCVPRTVVRKVRLIRRLWQSAKMS